MICPRMACRLCELLKDGVDIRRQIALRFPQTIAGMFRGWIGRAVPIHCDQIVLAAEVMIEAALGALHLFYAGILTSEYTQ